MANDYYTSSSNEVTAGTRARAADINQISQAIETGLDKLPSETNLKRGLINYAADTGAADAYVVTLTYVPASYADGMEVVFKASASNTGACTINVNSLGVKSITRQDGTTPVAGDIGANRITQIRYNSTSGNFEIQGSIGASAGTGTMSSQNANAVNITGGTAAALAISGGTISSTPIQDADGDTKIQTEESADEDKVRIDCGGAEKALFSGTATESYTQVNSHRDADGDTKIQVEESADEDHIRMDCGGTGDVLDISAQEVAVGVSLIGLTHVDPAIRKTANSGSLSITAGTATSDGGSIILRGDNDTPAGTISLVTGNTERLGIDASGNLSGSCFLDEDNMASNSATKVPSQQSVKNFVENHSASSPTRANATGLTIGSGATELDTVDLGTLTAGDIFMVQVEVSGIKGATAGVNYLLIGEKSGTAVCETLGKAGKQSLEERRHVVNGESYTVAVVGVFVCTTGGTYVLSVNGSSAGSDTGTATCDIGVSFLVQA